MERNNKTKVSIVVCCFNGESFIGECLRSIFGQSYPHDEMKVIVVDDGSIDNTAMIARSMGAEVIRFEKNKGIPFARNAGLAAAEGEFVVYIDSDCVADGNWLENLLDEFTNLDIVAVGGKVLAFSRDTLAERYMEATGYGNPTCALGKVGSSRSRLYGYLKNMMLPIMMQDKPVEVLAVYTANTAYRKSALERIGGFDESLQTNEDSDASVRLRVGQAKILYIPNAVVRHRHYRTLFSVVSRPYLRTPYMFKFYRKSNKMPPIFPFPILYLIALFLVFCFVSSSPLITILTAAALPFVLYWWWPIRGLRERNIEYFVYGYIQLAVESAVIIGITKCAIGMSPLKIIKDKETL